MCAIDQSEINHCIWHYVVKKHYRIDSWRKNGVKKCNIHYDFPVV